MKSHGLPRVEGVRFFWFICVREGNMRRGRSPPLLFFPHLRPRPRNLKRKRPGACYVEYTWSSLVQISLFASRESLFFVSSVSLSTLTTGLRLKMPGYLSLIILKWSGASTKKLLFLPDGNVG